MHELHCKGRMVVSAEKIRSPDIVLPEDARPIIDADKRYVRF
ncbi:MAG TPA: hypothetical protein P5013_06345 [Methanoregula sp.]|nr:hypothetical protein [Methanoregula sp.]